MIDTNPNMWLSFKDARALVLRMRCHIGFGKLALPLVGPTFHLEHAWHRMNSPEEVFSFRPREGDTWETVVERIKAWEAAEMLERMAQ